MTLLPSPVPHPLDFCPFDVPEWAYEALEWVVGFDWPAGNEAGTWDVADHWYEITTALTGLHTDADSAAGQVSGNYSNPAFTQAWNQVAAGDESPLAALLHLTDELGTIVEQCGSDLEAAKLEAWIEIGLFLTELLASAVAVALTVGAATPAAGGLITATRLAIQQIFKRLIEQLGQRAIKQTLRTAGRRAITQLSSREGLRRLRHEALHEGFEEMREEVLTNAGVQLYQGTGSRSHGFDTTALGRAATAGFAGGFSASGAGVGRDHHRHGGAGRSAGAEILGELGAAAANGNLADVDDLAKAAISGGAGSTLHPSTLPTTTSLNLPKSPPDAGPLSLPGTTPITPASTPPPSPSLLTSTGAPTLPPNAPPPGSHLDLHSPLPSPPSPTTAPSPPTAVPPPPISSPPTAASPPPTTLPPPTAALSPPTALPPASASPPPALPPATASSPPTALPPAATTSPPAAPSPATASSPLTALPPAASSPPPTAPSPAAASPPTTLPAPAAPSPPAAGSSSPTALPPAAPSPSTAGSSSPTALPPAALPHTAPSPPTAASSPPTTLPPTAPSPASLFSPATDPPLPGKPLPGRHAPDPTPLAPKPDISEIDSYFTFARDQRASYAAFRHRDTIDRLDQKATTARHRARTARRAARFARFISFDSERARHLDIEADSALLIAERAEAEARVLRDPAYSLDDVGTTTVDPRDWHLANRDGGLLAPDGVTLSNTSMLTGTTDPPSITTTRRYGEPGGLRPPLARHQRDLEDALPRDAHGRPQRLADPRTPYFSLLNDGGPAADPTRSINCQDCVLSFFDTYVHGRPRVSAPRTFDAYADGDPQRPQHGETIGPERIEHATGGRLQSLCKPHPGDSTSSSYDQVTGALDTLTSHLRTAGHGSFAFVLNTWEGGAAHAWAAVNQHGTILFVDPQSGRIAPPDTPLFTHSGQPDPDNLAAMDALVVDGNGNPRPFPNLRDGWWRPREHHLPPPGPRPAPIYHSTGLPPAATGTPHFQQTQAQLAEHAAFASLPRVQRDALIAAVARAHKVAVTESPKMHALAAALRSSPNGDRPQVVDESTRVKTTPSLARALSLHLIRGSEDLGALVDKIDDLVRFSISLPESSYAATVRMALRALEERSYRIDSVKSFWGGSRGRHYGLNVALTNPTGQLMELQFPTERSRALGKQTHDLYEIVRLGTGAVTGQERVEAFLGILAINKLAGIVDHQPADISGLPGIVVVDTSLANWIGKNNRQLWSDYLGFVLGEGLTLDQALDPWGLDRSDLPGIEGLIPEHDRSRLLPVSEGDGRQGTEQGDQLVRLPGSSARPSERGHMARDAGGMDLRPRGRSESPVRRSVRELFAAGRSGHGGEPGPGVSGHGVAEPRAIGGDGRGGAADGLALRPASGELIATSNNGPVWFNILPGQVLMPLRDEFRRGASYLDHFKHDHERRGARLLGGSFDVRVLQEVAERNDGLGNPDVLLRTDGADPGRYGELKWLNPDDPSAKELSNRLSAQLRRAFGQDPRIVVAVIDGRDVGLSIAEAQRGILRFKGRWGAGSSPVLPEHRIIVYTGEDAAVWWRGDSGEFDVVPA